MGDYFQACALPDVPHEEAERLGRDLAGWLVGRGILAEPAADAAIWPMGSHRAGAAATAAVDAQHHAAMTGPDALWLCSGVALSTGPEVHTPIQYMPDSFDCLCPACGARHSDAFYYEVLQGFSEWEGDGQAGAVACPACAATIGLSAWRTDPVCLVPSALTFTFWNWPPLSDGFLRELDGRAGHRVVSVSGKL